MKAYIGDHRLFIIQHTYAECFVGPICCIIAQLKSLLEAQCPVFKAYRVHINAH